jgi:hypothetical protein
MQNSHNLNAVLFGREEYQVLLMRDASQAIGQIVATSASQRMLRDLIASS